VQQSNTYIIIFSLILTIVLGGLLSGVSQVLGPTQKKAVELDTKKQILGAIPAEKEALADMSAEEVTARYQEVITSSVTNIAGDIITEDASGNPLIAENVNIEKNYKLPSEDRLFPVFKYAAAGNEAYILPTYGAGLWDAIWGFVAVSSDFNTIQGISMAHKGETPGLGARITEDAIQARYVGKEILGENGELVSVTMIKGEKNPESKLGPHKVDGMAGATITAVGVNNMLAAYLDYYKNYFDKNVKGMDALTMNQY
jgi:Na+-transporting NADH:ubiquinone oxidoreductase subunit C